MVDRWTKRAIERLERSGLRSQVHLLRWVYKDEAHGYLRSFRLPPEVLGRIFLINTQQNTKHEDGYDSENTTKLASQVCHHW